MLCISNNWMSVPLKLWLLMVQKRHVIQFVLLPDLVFQIVVEFPVLLFNHLHSAVMEK